MGNTHDTTIGGRPVTVQFIRVRHVNKRWGYYNRALVRFTDNNETHSMGAATFAEWSTKLDKEAKSGNFDVITDAGRDLLVRARVLGEPCQ